MRHDTDYSELVDNKFWRILRRNNTTRDKRIKCVRHLQRLLNILIKKCYNLYQKANNHKRNSKKYRKDLIYFGLLKHGNFNKNSSVVRTLRRRLKNVQTCLDYQNSLVLDALDLREKYLLYDIKKNKNAYNVLMPNFELLFIKQQNKLNRLLSRDVEYGYALTMAGILNNWSNRKWSTFNLYVSMYICF